MLYKCHKKNQRVLIVEDQVSDILGHYNLTHHLGFEVTLAFDGWQAVLELKKSKFDFIILDWNMPYMSGQKFLNYLEKKIKKVHGHPLKVILHTGETCLPENWKANHAYKIIDVWKKPLRAPEILKRLKGLL